MVISIQVYLVFESACLYERATNRDESQKKIELEIEYLSQFTHLANLEEELWQTNKQIQGIQNKFFDLSEEQSFEKDFLHLLQFYPVYSTRLMPLSNGKYVLTYISSFEESRKLLNAFYESPKLFQIDEISMYEGSVLDKQNSLVVETTLAFCIFQRD
jgi:hypothetical protein